MGNRNANGEHNNNINLNEERGVHEEILIQNDNQSKALPPSVKKIYAVYFHEHLNIIILIKQMF